MITLKCPACLRRWPNAVADVLSAVNNDLERLVHCPNEACIHGPSGNYVDRPISGYRKTPKMPLA